MAKKRSSAYWKKRFEQLEQMSHSYGQQTYMEVEPAFTQAQRSIQAQIEVWYQRFADNNGVTLAEARRLLTIRELAELKWDVQEYIKYGQQNALDGKWMKQLENASARFHISRLEALQLRSQQALEVAFGNELDAVDRMARKVFTEDYYHSIFEVQKGFNVGWEIGQIDERELDKVVKKPWSTDGKNFSDRIWSRKQQMIGDLHQELTRTLVQGKAPDEAIRHMQKFVDGKVKNAKAAASRLVMTEQAYFHSVSQEEAFNDLDVEEFEVVATLDSHTSEICQEMDGKHFPMTDYESGVTAPPFHPNCRSVTAPYFEDNYGGQRAARGEDGKTYYVPDNMTYQEWKDSMVEGHTENLKPAAPDGKVKTEADSARPEAPKTIDDCQTTEDVTDLFKSHGEWFYEMKTPEGKVIKSIDGMNLDGVDVESAKSVYRPYEKVMQKFPGLQGQLNAVNSAKLDGTVYANCMVGLGHGGITVNTQFFGNHEKLLKSLQGDVKAGFHPVGCATGDSIVMHEIGHAIDDFLTYTCYAAGLNGWKPKAVSAYLRPKVMKACGFKISDIGKQVSGYATKDAMEWFAECFSEYMCSDNPRPVAQEFGRQLEEMLAEALEKLKGGD